MRNEIVEFTKRERSFDEAFHELDILMTGRQRTGSGYCVLNHRLPSLSTCYGQLHTHPRSPLPSKKPVRVKNAPVEILPAYVGPKGSQLPPTLRLSQNDHAPHHSIRMRTAVPARPLLATYSSRIKSFDSRNRCSRTQLVNAPNLGSIASFTNDYAEHLTGYPAINTNPRYAIAHHAASISQPLHARMLICFAMQTLRNIHEHLSTDMRITFSGPGTSTLDLLIRRTSE
ncbi:hypothetical protein T09_7321 [Trichinella sp. T9]|nr:hypothetical protein T09_7321 [Trichinella sp. T9]